MKAIGDVLKDQVAEAAKKNQRDFFKKVLQRFAEPRFF